MTSRRLGSGDAVQELLFHHAREIAYVRYGVARAAPKSNLLPRPDCSAGCSDDDFHAAIWFDAAYRWAAQRLGFWPVFLAVGGDDEDKQMTGYQDQWLRLRREPTDSVEERRASIVLFSWLERPPGAVFMDFSAWHMVLNAIELSGEDPHRPYVRPLSSWEERQIWKRSWSASAWMRAARRHTSVQAVVPALDLTTADQVWCRNQTDREHLVKLGFDPETVMVRRLRR